MEDAKTLLSHMRYKEKEVSQKRMFLMGTSDTHLLTKKAKPIFCKCIPESFLRKDDVFYEDLKKLVEKGFGLNNADIEQHTVDGDLELRNFRHMSKIILGLLDDFSNYGLCRLAQILTEDSVNFQRTSSQMKKVIRKSLEELKGKQCPSNQLEIQSQVSELLRNQKNFRHNNLLHLSVTLRSHHDAIMKVLGGLGDMPTQTLSAMYRKLKGIRGFIPQLRPPKKSGWNRDRLIDRVRALCFEMMGQLDESDKLPEHLAKAMDVASLSSKLASGYQDTDVTRFFHVTPEVELLQNDIFQAIQSLGKRAKKKDIRELQLLLASETDAETGAVGPKAIKNMLTEFLFECSDLETIPDSLLNALVIINNKSSRRVFSKELVEEEVECILNLSADIKHILWDHMSGDKLDLDFADAYMEELEESHDGDFFDDDDDDDYDLQLFADRSDEAQMWISNFNEEEVQSCSSSKSDSSSSLCALADCFGDDEGMSTEISEGKMLVSPLDAPQEYDDMERQCAADIDLIDWVEPPMSESQDRSGNQYVALQEVSDEASVVLYRLIGDMMAEFAKMEELNLNWDDVSYLRGECSQDPVADSRGQGVSGVVADTKGNSVSAAVIQAVRKVMPSFSSSDLEKIEKLMSSYQRS